MTKTPDTFKQPPLLFPEGKCCFKAGEYDQGIPYYDCYHSVIPSFESDFAHPVRKGQVWRHKLGEFEVTIQAVHNLIRSDGSIGRCVDLGWWAVEADVFYRMFEYFPPVPDELPEGLITMEDQGADSCI